MTSECNNILWEKKDISYILNDSCRDLVNDNKYNIVILQYGILTLRLNEKIISYMAPCAICLNEYETIEFVDSNNLSA